MSAGCTTRPIVRWRGQWMATQCATVLVAHANQLPLPRLKSASGHESDSCKQRYSKYLAFIAVTCASAGVQAWIVRVPASPRCRRRLHRASKLPPVRSASASGMSATVLSTAPP